MAEKAGLLRLITAEVIVRPRGRSGKYLVPLRSSYVVFVCAVIGFILDVAPALSRITDQPSLPMYLCYR